MLPDKGHKMRKGKGRFFNRPSVSKGKTYDKFFIYVPIEVARDTAFPFRHGDRIQVEIKGNTLIVRKTKEDKGQSFS